MRVDSHRFGLWTLVALVVGNAIGAGIYTTSGYSLAALGSREWVLLAWFVGGLVALSGALSYGMLARRLQESGGEYLYLHRSIHPLAGFVAGWISLLAGFPGAIAFAATALEAYARAASSLLAEAPTDVMAVTVVLLGGTIHMARVQAGARVHEWIVVVMILAIGGAILWSGFEFVRQPQLPVLEDIGTTSFQLLAFANSLVWISLSYSGFNAAAYVSGEVRNAKTTVPRGMVIGTLVTLALCVVVNSVILFSTKISELQGQPEVVAIAAEALGGESARRTVEVIIALSLLTSITAMSMAGPRVFAKMAEDGALPQLFAAKRGQAPRTSIALQMGISLLLILLADLRELLSYLGLTLSLCLALAVSSLFVRHFRLGERPGSAWYPIAPMVFVGATVLFAVLSALNDIRQFYAVLPTVLMGCLAYAVSKRVSGEPSRSA